MKRLTKLGSYPLTVGIHLGESRIEDMAKKNPKKKPFKPFVHDELELKNHLIDYAQTLANKSEPESQLACAMIYASFTEYMADHLLDTLRHLMYQTTYTNYAAILYIDQRNDISIKTMGKTIGLLEDFGFPDKEEVIKLLREISKSRNNLFHNFVSTPEKDFSKLDNDITAIKEKTEELFTKINTLYIGLQKILIPKEDSTSS